MARSLRVRRPCGRPSPPSSSAASSPWAALALLTMAAAPGARAARVPAAKEAAARVAVPRALALAVPVAASPAGRWGPVPERLPLWMRRAGARPMQLSQGVQHGQRLHCAGHDVRMFVGGPGPKYLCERLLLSLRLMRLRLTGAPRLLNQARRSGLAPGAARRDRGGGAAHRASVGAVTASGSAPAGGGRRAAAAG